MDHTFQVDIFCRKDGKRVHYGKIRTRFAPFIGLEMYGFPDSSPGMHVIVTAVRYIGGWSGFEIEVETIDEAANKYKSPTRDWWNTASQEQIDLWSWFTREQDKLVREHGIVDEKGEPVVRREDGGIFVQFDNDNKEIRFKIAIDKLRNEYTDKRRALEKEEGDE